ncbi:proton-coupled amino acid transporter-like protein pathetic isoform X1 [Homalodisca vitripennis]|uniref:proton-coupled amino acid transporter-like protein pathetic isoform X1 n=2 Tax=Homalodisca vitripennis TaxID=197043 RepID=UPI001EECC7D8|nr:proton-coupled amino acid transporter-like protein pathetic isoform X1 [Homalodisca vitripennis]XP_046676953.1 proton-coupled amino acid transporter-like protein pathetic isoform X2 [Homalodisca vitripennis]XP_046676954.1 proton-coupled amino acid transporter-like protein pathetic isoform X1 [Homalodisca vitripennis]
MAQVKDDHKKNSFYLLEQGKPNDTSEDVENQPEEKGSDGHSLGVKHPTTYLESLFHLIKGNIGSGVFAMGDAFKNAGLLLAPVLTIFLGFVCIYGNHVLINCSKELGRRRKMRQYPTFPDTMEWSFQTGPKCFQRFSHTIRFLVSLFNIMAQLGFCSVYFVFISSTLHTILKRHGYLVDVHILMAIILIPMVSTAMVRNLKFLVPFSVLANILTGAGVCLTMYISMHDLPPITSRNAVGSISTIPLFFGTVIYCFEGIGLVLPLQSEMKNPDKFGSRFGVLNVGMTIVGCALLWVGFVGYLKYGEDVAGSLTLNLPKNSLFSEVVQLTIAIGLLFSYALQFHVAVTFVWPDYNRKYGPFKHPVLAECGIRLGMALITFVAAEVVPKLGLFISLLGSVSSTALALVFPPLCDLALHWDTS